MSDVIVRGSRLKWAALAALLVPLDALLGFAAGSVIRHAQFDIPGLLVTAVLAITLVTLVGITLLCAAQTLWPATLTVNDEGVRLSSLPRHRFWPWAEVEEVGTRRLGRGGAVKVVALKLKTADGANRVALLPSNWNVGAEPLKRLLVTARDAASEGADWRVQAFKALQPRRWELATSYAPAITIAALFLIVASRLALALHARPAATPPSRARFGAIAASPHLRRATSSWDYPDMRKAGWRALRDCRAWSGAQDCELRSVFRDRCAAYVITPNRKAGFLGEGREVSVAMNAALTSCRSTGGENCSLATAACTHDPPSPYDRPERDTPPV